jgi:hypothetical protein
MERLGVTMTFLGWGVAFVLASAPMMTNADERPAEQVPGVLPRVEARQTKELESLPEPARTVVSKRLGDRKLLAVCKGNFLRKSGEEYSAVEFDPKTLTLSVHVFDKINDVAVATVPIGYTKLSNLDFLLTSYEPLRCRSLAESKNWNSEIAQSGLYGVSGGLEMVSDLDTMCVAPDDANSVCFQYDPKKTRFVKIGGHAT